MSNQKLMKYLRPFSEDEKHHYLKNVSYSFIIFICVSNK